MVSAVANGSKTVALYSEKTAEIKTLKIGHGSKTVFFLFILVFTKIKYLQELGGNGGYFVSRIIWALRHSLWIR
jgi:hypothetical protein